MTTLRQCGNDAELLTGRSLSGHGFVPRCHLPPAPAPTASLVTCLASAGIVTGRLHPLLLTLSYPVRWVRSSSPG